MKEIKKKVKLADLVFNNAVYPRKEINSGQVMLIYRAIRGHIEAGLNIPLAKAVADICPPILADLNTGIVVDGHHRRRAMMKFDPDIEVVVRFKDYKSHKEIYTDAVRLNIGRGLDIGSGFDRIEAISKGTNLGFNVKDLADLFLTDRDEILKALKDKTGLERISEDRYQQMSEAGVPDRDIPDTVRVALKAPLREQFADRKMPNNVANLNRTIGGTSIDKQAKDIISQIQAGTVNLEKYSDILLELGDCIDEYVRRAKKSN